MTLNQYAPLAALTLCLLPAQSQQNSNPFAGRWDFTVTAPDAIYPSWMELTAQDGAPKVRLQGRSGSVRPVPTVKQEGSHLTLTMGPLTWDLDSQGDHLTGTQKRGDKTATLTGVPAPPLKRAAPKSWSKPEPLFNGHDLTGWEPIGPGANHWVAQDGILLNQEHGANLKTTRQFQDFKLHIEFNCPEKGNSGIYLRGRYEVQVEYEPAGTEDGFHSMGSVYGFLAPKVESPRKPGEWESFDITLVGRYVSIERNGVKTIDNQEIPGITGGALDSREAEPGPFYIQGDHTGGMKYRAIRVAVPKS